MINKEHIIYDEHILLRNLEEKGISSYDLIKQVDVFDIPEVLSFFSIIEKYLKMKELLNAPMAKLVETHET